MKPRRLHSATISSMVGPTSVAGASLIGHNRSGAPTAPGRPLGILAAECRSTSTDATNGHVFEVIQSMTDDPVTDCEVCGAPVERVFHPVAVHFKGSGFYTTDYAQEGRQRAAVRARARAESKLGVELG